MLGDALRSLFDMLVHEPGAEPYILELSTDMIGHEGRPSISRQDLVPAREFEQRYAEILSCGYAWVNLSFVGNLDGVPIVVLELPRSPGKSGTTAVNFSGPNRAVTEADLDASVFLELKDPST